MKFLRGIRGLAFLGAGFPQAGIFFTMNEPDTSLVFFLRHGHADWPDWDGPDDERPLTDKGRRETRKVARALHAARVKPSLILASPLPRAAQTAEITGKRLGVCVVAEPLLAKGFDAEKFAAILAVHPGTDLMLAGHEPDFSGVLRAVTGATLRLEKGGVAAVEIAAGETGRGTLVALLCPKLLKRVRKGA